MLTAQEIFDLTPSERRQALLQNADVYGASNELDRCRRLSQTINQFIHEYIELRKAQDKARESGSVLEDYNLSDAIVQQIKLFKPTATSDIKNSTPPAELITQNPNNIYEKAGAAKLAGAQKTARNLSTVLGLLWEKIATLSPYSISPEQEFGLKLKGIDLISKHTETGHIEYQQLKTQQNTLTGSQKPRTVEELSIHQRPVFCSCFALGPWTFNHDIIPRRSGTDFWSSIGINYDIFERHSLALLKELEQEFSLL